MARSCPLKSWFLLITNSPFLKAMSAMYIMGYGILSAESPVVWRRQSRRRLVPPLAEAVPSGASIFTRRRQTGNICDCPSSTTRDSLPSRSAPTLGATVPAFTRLFSKAVRPFVLLGYYLATLGGCYWAAFRPSAATDRRIPGLGHHQLRGWRRAWTASLLPRNAPIPAQRARVSRCRDRRASEIQPSRVIA